MDTNKLEYQLKKYTETGIYPFHMPGHKRRMAPVADLPYSWDVTEVEGTDNLHDAHGILREAMQRTASLFHARRTWYLVGGSTCGLLAAVRACVPDGGTLICARNCHKSVYHAIELQHLRVSWLLPPLLSPWNIPGSISPADVQNALLNSPDASAVLITSPTYEGILSDIRAIADICHNAGIPLIVDEAHGAHLGLFPESGFPAGALDCGADIVVQSAHKTLPSLTQTAFLHLGSDHISASRIEQQLDIFETSSPSYPLLASLDGCTGILTEQGAFLFRHWKEMLQNFFPAASRLANIQFFSPAAGTPDVFAFDRSKLLFRSPCCSGDKLAFILRNHYLLETEMSTPCCVLAMTSCCDSPDALQRLTSALSEIDRTLETAPLSSPVQPAYLSSLSPETVLPIGEAVFLPRESVPAETADGRIAAEYIYAYPPGIPLIVPGERISFSLLSQFRTLEHSAARQLRHSGNTLPGQISCLQTAASPEPDFPDAESELPK